MSFEDAADDESQLERHERRIRRCRTCQAKIIFLETDAGRSMPVDADTVDIGDGIFDPSKHVSHFSTCSDPGKHRRPR